MNYYTDVLKKYLVFSGRASRKEYWMFVLINFIISILAALIETQLHLNFISGIYSLLVLIPSIAVAARRLHDTNRSAWWLLIGLIPIIGIIVLIVYFALDSQPGDNEYGSNPKNVTVAV